MELDGRTFALTRGQLDRRLAQQTSYAGTECQFGLLARVESRVDADLREHTHCRALQENEQFGAAFFEVDSQAAQKTVDYLDVELATYGLSRFQHPASEAGETALSILCTRMPVSGLLSNFVSLQTPVNDFFSA
jgi:hypothetical protein